MSPRFDTVIVVDWSAAASPTPPCPAENAVWIGAAGEAPRCFRTRAEAIDWLGDRLAAEIAARRRTLVGFDFPFGYPRGFAAAATGRAEGLAVWETLAGMVRDGPRNANNRFEVAAALNARLPGVGPFWGRPRTLALADLPEGGRARRGHGMAERRHVEARVARAQPVWKLYTTGSVGGQALTGLAALHGLRLRLGCAVVWPFETALAPPTAPVALAEVYPSLLAGRIAAARHADEPLDRAQVRVTAAALAALDRLGGLDGLFAAAADLGAAARADVAREEAWILGVGAEAALARAA